MSNDDLVIRNQAERPFVTMRQHRMDQDMASSYKILQVMAHQSDTRVCIYQRPDELLMLVFENPMMREELEVVISKWQLAGLAKAVAKGFEWMGGE